MSVKVIYSECAGQLWLDVAGRMSAESGWEPAYWISATVDKSAVNERFPETVFHDRLEAIRGMPHPDWGDHPMAALDQSILHELAFHESLVMRMMERMDPKNSFTYPERVRLYHTLLRYWSAVLERYKPDIVVFPNAPHVVYDYIFYTLCRRAGVKTVMFERTSIPGLLFPVERFEDGSNHVADRYAQKLGEMSADSPALTPGTEEYLATVSGDYSNATPFYVRRNFEAIQNLRAQRTFTAGVKRAVRRLTTFPMIIYRFLALPAPSNYLKENGKNIEDSDISGFAWRLNRRAANRTKRRLEQYYNGLAGPVDFQTPYIYVSLSYQPEKTTSPSGGAFVHQSLMLDMLSKTLPGGWSIYVKEFPFQLQPFKMGERSRAKWFYDDLVSMPNVKLVPLDMSPFPLIDNAKAVATVSGNTGWESVVRGKPSLVFGYPWYRHCEGVFYTPTLESCRDAISQIAGGYLVDHEKVRLFAQTLEEVCFKGYLDPIDQAATGLSHEDNVQGFSQALTEFWQGLPDSPETDAQQQAAGSPVSEPSFRN